MTPDTLNVLRTTSLFAGFNDEQLEMVPKVGHRHTFEPGEVVVEEGATGEQSLWLVLEGEVEVMVGGQPHRRMGPGTHFGEMALLTEAPRSADVVARSATTALEFSRRHLEGLISANPKVAIDMLAELATRLREATEALAAVLRSSPDASEHAGRLGFQVASDDVPHLGPIEYALSKGFG